MLTPITCCICSSPHGQDGGGTFPNGEPIIYPCETCQRAFESIKTVGDALTNPWGRFLIARRAAITWLVAEFNYSDEQIASILSMDPFQVRLIRMP